MQAKEKKICSFTQNGTRLQLLKLTEEVEQIFHDRDFKPYKTGQTFPNNKYQIRLNRKIIDTSISEYQMRKLFATYAQNIVLQLKIY